MDAFDTSLPGAAVPIRARSPAPPMVAWWKQQLEEAAQADGGRSARRGRQQPRLAESDESEGDDGGPSLRSEVEAIEEAGLPMAAVRPAGVHDASSTLASGSNCRARRAVIVSEQSLRAVMVSLSAAHLTKVSRDPGVLFEPRSPG